MLEFDSIKSARRAYLIKVLSMIIQGFVRSLIAWLLYGYFRESYLPTWPDFGYWETYGIFMLVTIVGTEFNERLIVCREKSTIIGEALVARILGKGL